MTQVCEWEPGTWYGEGSIVVYQGARYKIIQPHTSEPGWEPPATPALWGRMQEEYGYTQQQGYGGAPAQQQGYGGGDGGYNPSYVQPAQAPQPPQASPGGYGDGQGYSDDKGQGYEEKRWDEHQEQQVEIHHEERQKHWYDLDEKRKKQLEIGGGLAAGAALLGAGYYAYHNHQKSEEEKKAQVWALQNWIQEAEARTRAYYANGPRGPATWVLAEGGKVPDGAIAAGEQQGRPLYIVRAFHELSAEIGKVSPAFQQGAMIGYGFKEFSIPKYEVLVGDHRALHWVDVRGRVNVRSLPGRPVEGGREADGTPLLVARVRHGESVIPGKAGEKLDGAVVPANNTEIVSGEYQVLCYA
ncbi:hypothetical protein IEO21_06891 [Rhodonia placenta]|uniref:Chitin-binding type-3 domain-containing protein n=1 Tax=Rhodonia placenta TaxID=104341 RepID=A0A8H7U065_9APHY|nr:hypothetical protein IEO21_06891 [Postia placenta]